MIVVNTSRYPKTDVRKLIRFAAQILGIKTSGVEVHVKNCITRRWRCRAYNGIPHVANVRNGAKYLITLGIGHENRFPVHAKKSKMCPAMTYRTWDEALVALAGHELTHIHQFRYDLARSEVEAERNAKLVLREYRRKNHE